MVNRVGRPLVVELSPAGGSRGESLVVTLPADEVRILSVRRGAWRIVAEDDLGVRYGGTYEVEGQALLILRGGVPGAGDVGGEDVPE